MKTIHSITVAILPEGAPKYATTKRTFYFASVEDRMAFEATLDGTTAQRCGVNIDHVMTVKDALREVEREKKLILGVTRIA